MHRNNINNKVYFWIAIVFFAFISCDKDEETDSSDGWGNCYDCTVDSWVGTFAGNCDYYDAGSNEYTYSLPVNIEIEETATDYLSVFISVPNYYSTTISGYLQSPYILSITSTTASFSASMYVKEGAYKLSGNSKKFVMQNDTAIMTKSITFDILKSE